MFKDLVLSTFARLPAGRTRVILMFVLMALLLAVMLVPQVASFACGGVVSCPCPGC